MSDSSRPAFSTGKGSWNNAPMQHPLRFNRFDPAIITPLLDISPDGYIICNADHICLYGNRAACAIFGRDTGSIQQRPVSLLLPQRGDEAADQFILRASRWSSVILRPDGERREVECIQTVVESQGEWFTIIVLRDMTHQRQLERKAEVLAQFATTMVSADSLEATLNALARSVVQATGVMACLVPLISGSPPLFRVVGSYGLPAGYTASLSSMVQHGILLPTLQAFEERRIVVMRGLRQALLADARYIPVHSFLQVSGWDTVVCVPLIYRGECRGVFTVYCAPEQPLDDEEIAFFSAIADQAAVAVEHARLLLAVQEKAALEERQRLARELHDSVSQALYGISLGAQAARASLETDWAHARESLDYVLSLTKATHAEMRSLIFALHPESLQSEGIVEALSRHAAAISGHHEIQIETHLCAEPALPLEAKEALYRITQEALHNSIKHAHADYCQVSLSERQEAIVLEVCDNGTGFDTSSTFPGHLGLHSMRERARDLGGTLEVHSSPAEGTQVRAVLPFAKQAS